jgi:hypothetical protein
MPRKRKTSESSVSQYKPEDDEDFDEELTCEERKVEYVEQKSDEEENDDDDDDDGPKKPPARKPVQKDETDNNAPRNSNEKYSKESYLVDEHGNRKHITPANRRTWRRKVIHVDEEELKIPSIARKTAQGGYVATSVHRAKISKANAGNVPWNFGRHRSNADKAKIAVGVRARNRQRLLRQLEQLGMPEQEWLVWKKKINDLRQHISRVRCENRKNEGGTYNAHLKGYQKMIYKDLIKKRNQAKVCRRHGRFLVLIVHVLPRSLKFTCFEARGSAGRKGSKTVQGFTTGRA